MIGGWSAAANERVRFDFVAGLFGCFVSFFLAISKKILSFFFFII